MNGPKHYCENAALLPKSNIPYTCGEDANSGRKLKIV